MKFADASDGLATKRLRSLKRPFAIKRAQALCGATFSFISGYQERTQGTNSQVTRRISYCPLRVAQYRHV